MSKPSRIHVILRGRTGNNLFQYALGRALAERHGSELILDASLFRARDWAQASCIERLPLQAGIRRPCPLLSRTVRKLTGRHPREWLAGSLIRESADETGFDPRHLDAPADCVISGFFQSVRYFESIEGPLRRELDPGCLPWADAIRARAADLEATDSVAVHVRRTDYVGHPVFDLCGPNYYHAAMETMRQQVPGCHFFLFSDDPEWCRSHLTGHDSEVLSMAEGREDPLHDLFLMSRARHQIIANSSYSWWAAWLAKHAGQRVLAPDRWLGGGMHAPIGDRLCPGWECISV